MSAKFFYLFIVVGVLLIGVAAWSFLQGHPNGYTSISFDLVAALIAFYRAYRIYRTKNDQDLM